LALLAAARCLSLGAGAPEARAQGGTQRGANQPSLCDFHTFLVSPAALRLSAAVRLKRTPTTSSNSTDRNRHALRLQHERDARPRALPLSEFGVQIVELQTEKFYSSRDAQYEVSRQQRLKRYENILKNFSRSDEALLPHENASEAGENLPPLPALTPAAVVRITPVESWAGSRTSENFEARGK
jgi:hypothetical protein